MPMNFQPAGERFMQTERRLFIAIVTTTLLLVSMPVFGKGKGFKDVVKHIEKNYQAKKRRVPMLGVANFFVKIIRPAGVKGFKLAVFQDQDFSPTADAVPFQTAMREAYDAKKGWKPLVTMHSKRDGGNNRVFIMFKENKKDVEVAVTTLEAREAAVIEVKFSPDKMAQFLDNPRIMGISLGKGVRGGNQSILGNAGGVITGNVNTGNAGGVRPAPRNDRQPDPVAAPEVTILPDAPAAGEYAVNAPARPVLKTRETNPATNEESLLAATDAVAKVAEPKPVVDESNTIRIETRLVNLNVKAVDKQGQPLTDLKPADFTVTDDETKEEITHFKPVTAPVNLLLMLDLSGSTKNKRKPMIEAARRFVDALPANDRMAIVAFTRRYRVLSKLTSDKEALKLSLERIKGIEGGTAYYDSLWKAFDDLGQLADARKAIVVLTDGEDESLMNSAPTAHTFDDLLQRASEDDVTVYPIYFKAADVGRNLSWMFSGSMNIGSGSVANTARKQLEALAEQTGGVVINAQSEEALNGAYDKVAQELHSLYSMAYAPDRVKHDGSFRKIAVQVKREGAVAKTRKGYYDK
jgi:VWFA-related protein